MSMQLCSIQIPKGKLTIRYVQEGKEIHQLFQDLYKVTQ